MYQQSSVISLSLYILHTLHFTSSTDQIFTSRDTSTQWTIPDVTYPEPVFKHNINPTSTVISRLGYPVEKHFIQTEDGYILGLHRIPPQGPTKLPPVLMIHGFLGASDQWMFRNDSSLDLPFLISKSGLDVWLGNLRGNVYSRHHAKLSPDKMEFWEFSLDEHGSRDLPAMIELIRFKTGQDRLVYIGYSIGGALPYIMSATRPEYTRFIALNILLAPFVFGAADQRSTIVNNIKPLIDFRVTQAYKSHSLTLAEVSPRTNDSIVLLNNLCGSSDVLNNICATVLQDLVGYDTSIMRMKNRKLARLLGYSRSGTSISALYHIWNIYKTSRFLTYDSLPLTDVKRKGYRSKVKPPIIPFKRNNDQPFTSESAAARGTSNDAREFDVTKMNAPTIIWYSENDRLVDKQGIKKLSQLSPNVIKLNLISYKRFNHWDYWLHKDVNQMVNYQLIDQMKRFFSSYNYNYYYST
uniref:Lipase member K n=1 Tax=Cacopsylla melanoneura TaxID=428564 RepID=A0A8D8WXT6_9HEMI